MIKKLSKSLVLSLMLPLLMMFCLCLTACNTNKHTHKFANEWSHNETGHYHECECGEKDDVVNHVYDNACDTTCNECEATRTITHDHATTWSHDATNHWHECSVCGNKKDNVAHDYHNKVVEEQFKATDATHTAKATYYYSCECGVKGTETFESGEMIAHVYDKQVVANEFKATDATCTAKATYYLSCECGAKGTTTFKFGSTIAHEMENHNDSNYHWEECKNCEHETDKESHTWVMTTTHPKGNNEYYHTCDVCEEQSTHTWYNPTLVMKNWTAGGSLTKDYTHLGYKSFIDEIDNENSNLNSDYVKIETNIQYLSGDEWIVTEEYPNKAGVKYMITKTVSKKDGSSVDVMNKTYVLNFTMNKAIFTYSFEENVYGALRSDGWVSILLNDGRELVFKAVNGANQPITVTIGKNTGVHCSPSYSSLPKIFYNGKNITLNYDKNIDGSSFTLYVGEESVYCTSLNGDKATFRMTNESLEMIENSRTIKVFVNGGTELTLKITSCVKNQDNNTVTLGFTMGGVAVTAENLASALTVGGNYSFTRQYVKLNVSSLVSGEGEHASHAIISFSGMDKDKIVENTSYTYSHNSTLYNMKFVKITQGEDATSYYVQDNSGNYLSVAQLTQRGISYQSNLIFDI